MNENLRKLIQLYATESSAQVEAFLSDLSKPSLKALLLDLLTLYFNDKNSSYLRELATLYVAGYEPIQGKLGYNGYRMAADGTRQDCEVKPQNTDNPRKKLNGGGSFNDYTLERFEKDREQAPQLLIAGFVQGKLLYVLEVPFRCIEPRLGQVLAKRFPSGKRGKGEYLRSASFTYRDYQSCQEVALRFLDPAIRQFSAYLAKGFFDYLHTL
ncbi:MAG: hypothetical protein NZ580_02310 [Bacteroidia bacterium]|nr:hypothetical protein [Bacteroidia bacterium]